MYHIYVEFYNNEYKSLELETPIDFYSTLDRLLDSDYRVIQIKKMIV